MPTAALMRNGCSRDMFSSRTRRRMVVAQLAARRQSSEWLIGAPQKAKKPSPRNLLR